MSRVSRAAKHIDAVELSDGRWAHYADETGRWYVVDADDLEELCDYLDDEDEAIRRDAYSHWCAGTSDEEMPEGWTPSAYTEFDRDGELETWDYEGYWDTVIGTIGAESAVRELDIPGDPAGVAGWLRDAEREAAEQGFGTGSPEAVPTEWDAFRERAQADLENAVWSAIEIVSGEGDGEGTIESYDGERTLDALRARLESERCNGDRWAFARPAGSTNRDERFPL